MVQKQFVGAPFGTQKSRFDVSGVHPKRRPPGSIMQVGYNTQSKIFRDPELGPGPYNIDNGTFSIKNMKQKTSGPGWKKAYETSQAAKVPHFLYREEWEKKQMQKRMLGPGTYSIPDSFDELSKKPRSTRGICQTRAQRFAIANDNTVPGPGTYGKGGVPHALLEEKQSQSTSTVGMLDGSSGKRQLPEVGSDLCPGQYNCKSFIDELSERVISKRGPYDLFTGDRNKPIASGHFASPKSTHLGPGEYGIKSFVDAHNFEHKKRHGKFGKVARFPNVPTERIHCKTLSQWPRKSNEPGPGSYDPQDLSRPDATKRPPFGSSAERSNKKATELMLGSNNTVGPGRYHVRDWHDKQYKNGNQSVFNSNTKRWDPIRDKYLMDRIRPKDVPVTDRVFMIPTCA